MVKVTYGLNQGEFELAGTTVGQVREKCTVAFNIERQVGHESDPIVATVNGVTVLSDHVLRDGQHLEFIKSSGKKGF